MADIFSVSNCISRDSTDLNKYVPNNQYYMFDTPEIIENLASEENIDLSESALFYYEVYEYEFNGDSKEWVAFTPNTSIGANVQIPADKQLQGFDVATFSVNLSVECSPLSCNSLANKIPVNQHCLFNRFEEAKAALEQGLFECSEPGPYRIFAVYTIGSR